MDGRVLIGRHGVRDLLGEEVFFLLHEGKFMVVLLQELFEDGDVVGVVGGGLDVGVDEPQQLKQVFLSAGDQA